MRWFAVSRAYTMISFATSPQEPFPLRSIWIWIVPAAAFWIPRRPASPALQLEMSVQGLVTVE